MRKQTEEELDKERVEKEEQASRQALSDLRKVLSLAEGRRVLYRIIYASHLGSLEQVVDIASSNTVIFHQGQRTAAKRLLNECLVANPKRTKVMLKESLDE